MTTFLIVLVAILVICCGIMLYLYFSVRKEADDLEGEKEFWNKNYNAINKYWLECINTRDNLSNEVKSLKENLAALEKENKQLKNELDDQAIHVVNTYLMTEWREGSIDIPMEFLQELGQDDLRAMRESERFDNELRYKLARMIGDDILKSSTGFALDYSTFNNSCKLLYKYPRFEQSATLRGYLRQIDPEKKLPMLSLIREMSEEVNRR